MDLYELRESIREHYCVDEIAQTQFLLSQIERSSEDIACISEQAHLACEFAIANPAQSNSLQTLLSEYQLSSSEGIALMSLTEALLRIPDRTVAAKLMADRIAPLNWEGHLKEQNSSILNASTLLLALTGKLLTTTKDEPKEGYLHRLIRKVSQPVIHNAMTQVIVKLADQFVFAETTEQALATIQGHSNQADNFSLDMLGEAAVSEADAHSFLSDYQAALKTLTDDDSARRCGLSIKLSALHPRYEYRHKKQCIDDLYERLCPLIELAAERRIQLTLDAEEASRLELSLDLFSRFHESLTTEQLSCLGLAVQAYGTRALPVLNYLRALAEEKAIKIPVRLVKGAYWDSEVKQAQVEGLEFYPVYTEKHHTDISYLACAEFLLNNRHYFYPQFATHNAVTIADILFQHAPDGSYEFQRLHGMGEAIYDGFRTKHPDLPVRVYCPVGRHQVLLPYLVRRIMENGANSSFVRQVIDDEVELDELCRHPLDKDMSYEPAIPLPSSVYSPQRKNSKGLNLANPIHVDELMLNLARNSQKYWIDEEALVREGSSGGEVRHITDPYNGTVIGECNDMTAEQVELVLYEASQAYSSWKDVSCAQRREKLLRMAELLSQQREELISLLVREGGKTIQDALGEVREAEDFALYYAEAVWQLKEQYKDLPGTVGERNQYSLDGRGVFLCISPWNFPLAIFCGQVFAALAAGNTVLAKPASNTPIVARLVVSLLHEAGFPKTVVQLIVGKGDALCRKLFLDRRLAGVAFTGSTQAARKINQALAEREFDIIPFIAETGGQNVMIVDSSALAEQVVKDVLKSAFYSAGQRCSALRVLYLQEEVADSILQQLKGAIETLVLGDPGELATDIGPVISDEAKTALIEHCRYLETKGKLVFKLSISEQLKAKRFVAPHVFEIESINELKAEFFGPILHVVRYRFQDIDRITEEVNGYGFGLTCGIQSRNEVWANELARRLNVGNIYLNRDMVGAIVGAQPFGGQGLSGTGFKAGGPFYLLKFMAEKTLSSNLSAIGGDVNLLTSSSIK